MPKIKNPLIRFLFFNQLVLGVHSTFLRKWYRRRLVKKIIYASFARVFRILKRDNGNIYFYGWPFVNPDGIKNHREEIVEYLKPKPHIAKKVVQFLEPLQKKFAHIIGVHYRLGDYRTCPKLKEYYFSQQELNKILDDYVVTSGKNREKTVFIICSDEPQLIQKENFPYLNLVFGPGNEIEDLLTLASTDMIIGSNSNYGRFAAYYGDVPFKLFLRQNI